MILKMMGPQNRIGQAIYEEDYAMKIELKCSQEQFEKIHEDLDKTRRTSETVRLDRAALQALLIDHGVLHAALKTGA